MYAKREQWQTTMFIRLSVFLELPCIYFTSSQYSFSVRFNHCALRNCTWRIRPLNVVNRPTSVNCCRLKGGRNEQTLKSSVPSTSANGEWFSSRCKASHFSSFITNRAIKCWLPKGQSIVVWVFSLWDFFFFWEASKIQNMMMLMQTSRRQTPTEESTVCPSTIEQRGPVTNSRERN